MPVDTRLVIGLVVGAVALVAVSTTVGVLVTKNQNNNNNGGDENPPGPHEFDVGPIHLDFGAEGHTVDLEGYSAGEILLKGTLGKTLPEVPEEAPCPDGGDGLCLEFSEASLKVTARSDEQYNVQCEDFQWDATDCRASVFEDCWDMRGAHWYGATQIQSQQWPIEKWVRPSRPYVTGDSYQDEYGGVQERYWLSSNGVAIYAQFEVPLWLSINSSGDNSLCLKAQYQDSVYETFNYERHLLFMNYTVCRAEGIREVHQYMLDNYLGKPTDIPDEMLFRYPIWSTWAQYKRDIDQVKVGEYAENILSNGFNISQLEIDDDWEYSYGYLDFNDEKFPDPKQMVADLTERGIRTTIWIHPFVDLISEYVFVGGILFHYFKDPGGLLPALTTWWNGIATHVDFTQTRSTRWFKERLQYLRDEYGIHSFKFDAGESNLMPASTIPGTPFNINPTELSTLYAEMAYNMDEDVRSQEVRVGAKTQHLPIFVRMMDKDSNWGFNNGLKTIIPHALTYSVLGYPFVLPDMIGGNSYNVLPEKELFIRWVQLNAFLPGFQFSIAPWDYDQEVIDICKGILELHEQYADTMIALAREATQTGAPIIRPLWWIAPTDEVALTIDSQFLLGSDLLVAPVQDQGARARDIYLPAGQWEDKLRGGTVTGGQWLNNYTVELNELAYFTRVNDVQEVRHLDVLTRGVRHKVTEEKMTDTDMNEVLEDVVV